MRRLQRLLLTLGLTLLLAGPPLAQEALEAPRVDPSINAPYQDPDFEEWVERFERPGREVYDKRREILSATALKPGMAVADIGAGTGLFTLLFAEAVGPKGRVYAVDISETFVQNILRRALERGLKNVEGIVNTQAGAALDAESVDRAFLADTYHHLEQPEGLLASIHRALRPGGQLVVIDFRREGGSGWVREHVRAGKAAVIEEIEAAGFRLIEDSPLLRTNYLLRFEKREK